MEYYLLYTKGNFDPVMWRKRYDYRNSKFIWECKFNEKDWLKIDEFLYEEYIPRMISIYGQKMVSL